MGPLVSRLGDRGLAKSQMGGHVPAQSIGRRAQERALHKPSAAGFMALMHCRQNRRQGGKGRGMIAKSGTAGKGLLVGGDMRAPYPALGPEDRNIKSRQVDIRPLQANAGYAGIDQFRHIGLEGLIIQPSPLQGTGTHIGNENICTF